MTQTEALELALEGGGLYEITGRIEDIDKCIVHRSVIKEVLAQPAVPQGHEQEPVGKIVDCDFVGHSIARFEPHLPFGTLLYTFPSPQRPSRSDIKPLTDEQLKPHYQNQEWLDGVRFAEAAHGIKEEA